MVYNISLFEDAAGEETLCDDPEAAERAFLEWELWREKHLTFILVFIIS